MWRDLVGWVAALAFASTPPVGSNAVDPTQGVPPAFRETALQSSTLRPMLQLPRAAISIPNLPQEVLAIHQGDGELLRRKLEEAGEAFIQQNFERGIVRRTATKRFNRCFDKLVRFVQTHTEQVAFRAEGKTFSVWMRMESGMLHRLDVSVDRGFLSRTTNLKLWSDANGDGRFDPKENIDLNHLKLDKMF